jgi:hypothetical protein
MRRFAVSVLLAAMLISVALADWDYSSQKFGAGVALPDIPVYNEWDGWFPYFPGSGIEMDQFWGRRFGLIGIRLIERVELSTYDVGLDGSVDASLIARLPFALYSSVHAALRTGIWIPEFEYGHITSELGIVWNQNDQDFLVGSRELWYEGFGLRAKTSTTGWLRSAGFPATLPVRAEAVVPYTVRFDWGRLEAGPEFRFVADRPFAAVSRLFLEPGLDIRVFGGQELTDISQFPEEHADPRFGWAVAARSVYTLSRVPLGGDTSEFRWFGHGSMWSWGAVRIPVVAGLHVEPALEARFRLTHGSLGPDLRPFLRFGYVLPIRAEKYLVARLATRASSWKFWERPELSFSFSYGCRAVTRVGDDETMQGPGGTMDPWKEQHQNPSP